MKSQIATLTSLLAGVGSLTAHPGHDHSHMPPQEEVVHHLSSGGFLAIAALGGVGIVVLASVLRARKPATNRL